MGIVTNVTGVTADGLGGRAGLVHCISPLYWVVWLERFGFFFFPGSYIPVPCEKNLIIFSVYMATPTAIRRLFAKVRTRMVNFASIHVMFLFRGMSLFCLTCFTLQGHMFKRKGFQKG